MPCCYLTLKSFKWDSECKEAVPKASCWPAMSGTEGLTLPEKHVTIKSSQNIKIVQWVFSVVILGLWMLFWLQLHSLLQLPEQQSLHFPALYELKFFFKTSMTATFAKLPEKLTISHQSSLSKRGNIVKECGNWFQGREKMTIFSVSK